MSIIAFAQRFVNAKWWVGYEKAASGKDLFLIPQKLVEFGNPAFDIFRLFYFTSKEQVIPLTR